ncbi:hypothetical protein OJAV_G00059160 [Oryzias javanicus]|uniref:Gastrin/cholecystokinin peptide hormone domain-containing protein n=1 Tax=Oryzias javanicus TaxID=123683 RepID=A0A437DB56_ORYJA|nr:hypothetical protein OJAV_G00059160 [Oryzias javanicus]
MKVWISCLLLGSISCSPQGDGSHSQGQNHMWPFFLSPFSFGPEPSAASSHRGLPQSSNMDDAIDPGFWAQVLPAEEERRHEGQLHPEGVTSPKSRGFQENYP